MFNNANVIIFETCPDGIAFSDCNFNITAANRAFCSLIGYELTELLNLKIQDITPKKWLKIEQKAVQYLERFSKNSITYYKQYLKKNGELVSVQQITWKIVDSEQNCLGYWAYVKDKTMENESKVQIRRQKNRIRHVVNTIPDLVCCVDSKLKVLFVNESFCEFYGIADHKIVGRLMSKFLSEREKFQLYELINSNGFVNGSFFNCQLKKLRNDTDVVQWSVLQIPSKEKLKSEFMLIGKSLSLKKRESLMREQEQHLNAMGKLATTFFHEMRTPLSSILFSIDLLRKQTVTESRLENQVQIIEEEGKQLYGVVCNLLKMSQKMEFENRTVNVSNLIDCAWEILEFKRQKNPYQFNNTVSNVFYFGDKQIIMELFQILLSNSLEACPEGGTISVRSIERTGVLELYITDTGHGISEPELIFEPYYSTKDGGTGLGLPYLRKMLTAINGTIQLVSSSKGNTEFMITLSVE